MIALSPGCEPDDDDSHSAFLVIRYLVGCCTESGFTALHYAAWFNHPEAIKALACAGANLGRTTKYKGDNDKGYM